KSARRPREQLRRTTCALVALRVTPAFLLVIRGLAAIVLRNVVEHEATSFVVHKNAALATNPLRHENSAHTRRPHHTRGMKLHELHVLKRSACIVRERLAVASVLPAVARYAVSAADSARGQHHRSGDEHLEAPALPVVRERWCWPRAESAALTA